MHKDIVVTAGAPSPEVCVADGAWLQPVQALSQDAKTAAFAL
jgi:hypothetical protein